MDDLNPYYWESPGVPLWFKTYDYKLPWLVDMIRPYIANETRFFKYGDILYGCVIIDDFGRTDRPRTYMLLVWHSHLVDWPPNNSERRSAALEHFKPRKQHTRFSKFIDELNDYGIDMIEYMHGGQFYPGRKKDNSKLRDHAHQVAIQHGRPVNYVINCIRYWKQPDNKPRCSCTEGIHKMQTPQEN